MNKEEKAKLWADRIQQYKTSGQTCKQWCAENDIPLSTMGYWTRRLAKEDPASEPEQDLVFARLPSEQEAARKLLSEETAPVRIFVSDSIRIEISDSCRPELMESYNGLAAIIKLKFHLDPYSRCMFAFCNRRRTSIKILQWDGSGFWILMKRLDRNAFHWPDTPDELRQVTLKEIHWLCDGLSLNPRGAFEEHHPKIIL